MITADTKRILFSHNITEVFANFLVIQTSSRTLRFIDNAESFTFEDNIYKAKPFDFTPEDPSSSDSTASISIEDVEREITELIQETNETPKITVFCLRLSDVDNYIDGPTEYKVQNVSVQSKDNKVNLSLSKQSQLSYTASSHSYSNLLFPGLF